ncbi:putative HD superfamily hydrolase [Anaerohalosphaera lusitana]|uniref:Putative HD superfamily hydrolase n=1 Tax=Anaerohalosphaera lusitana TaxID=1936003 RepID=A0A1U9NH08_9BACT|nr:hypothetical protein [Anaerohalosphaera lusitana]AQT67085.1 putative HD superfamily hydrolase [Anaerohalosphaera lusitana]
MAQTDAIRELAHQAVAVPTLSGKHDTWLWDRTQRLVRNVEHIARLPEITNSGLSVDRFCLTAAAYFCDAGFARYADPEDPANRVSLADVSTSDLHDFSTQIATEKLTNIIPGPKIDKINKIIYESSNRLTKTTEALILADARSLDDMGAVGIFNEFRRYAIHGKSATDALQSWKRKIDYHYWQTRLDESFNFDTVRELAARRFSVAEKFMTQLQLENSARDLEEMILESLDPLNEKAG